MVYSYVVELWEVVYSHVVYVVDYDDYLWCWIWGCYDVTWWWLWMLWWWLHDVIYELINVLDDGYVKLISCLLFMNC